MLTPISCNLVLVEAVKVAALVEVAESRRPAVVVVAVVLVEPVEQLEPDFIGLFVTGRIYSALPMTRFSLEWLQFQ